MEAAAAQQNRAWFLPLLDRDLHDALSDVGQLELDHGSAPLCGTETPSAAVVVAAGRHSNCILQDGG